MFITMTSSVVVAINNAASSLLCVCQCKSSMYKYSTLYHKDCFSYKLTIMLHCTKYIIEDSSYGDQCDIYNVTWGFTFSVKYTLFQGIIFSVLSMSFRTVFNVVSATSRRVIFNVTFTMLRRAVQTLKTIFTMLRKVVFI